MHRVRISNLSLHPETSSVQLCNILLVASLTKTLSKSGTSNLDPNLTPISEPLVLQILRRKSLASSKKLDFFRWCSSLKPHYKHSASTYAHIFRTICHSGFLEEVPSLLVSMKDDNVVVDSKTFQILLDSFIRCGKFDVALEILDFMKELGTSLNSNLYDSIIVALVRKNQISLALSIFLKLLDGFNNETYVTDGDTKNTVFISSIPGSIVCNELLVALRKADRSVEFKRVFDRLSATKGFEFDTWGYNICIHAFGCWGDLGTSLKLFKDMKEFSLISGSVAPDLCTYNSLIHSLCLVGKVEDALIVWEELKGSGHDPDAYTYRLIIQGCCKAYRMDEALRIFSEMQYNGLVPHTIVYNCLLDGMFKTKNVMAACQLFEKMVQDGVKASCWTYNILIDGLFRNGRAEAGYTLFCDLKKKGQFVDAVTYSIVVLQLCRVGQLEEALRLVEEMEARGYTVDLVTITSLLIGFHKHGHWNLVDKLMKHIRDGNLVPHVLKWKADMEASIKRPQSKRKDFTSMFPSEGDFSEILRLIGSPDDTVIDVNHESESEGIKDEAAPSTETDPWSSSPHMDQLANEVKSIEQFTSLISLNKGRRVQGSEIDSFDVDMVNTFLSILLGKGNLSIACKLFEIFSDMGVDYMSYTYNSMMSSFVKKGYFNEAWGVLNQMDEKVSPADIATYNVIIQGLGKLGRADLASAVLDKLTKHGGYLDIVMYNTLINAFGKTNRIDEANKLFEQMRSIGISPDVYTYNTLIEVHSKAGRLKEAYKFLKMMLDAGCSPNHVTDTILDYLGKEMEKLRYQKASIVRTRKDAFKHSPDNGVQY